MAQPPVGGTKIPDVTELFPYYNDARKPNGAQPEAGQIVWAPVTNSGHRPMIADAVRQDPADHHRSEMRIRPHDPQIDFRGKANRLPIKALNLESTAEIVVSTARMRPCLVLTQFDGVDANKLPVAQQGKARAAFQAVFLLAPIYSVSTADKVRAFGPTMTARVKCLMYPEFVFVPRKGLTLKSDGVARFDRSFWSPLIFGIQPENLFVSNEVMGIAWNQIRLLIGQEAAKDYEELRDLMLACLPDEYKEVQK